MNKTEPFLESTISPTWLIDFSLLDVLKNTKSPLVLFDNEIDLPTFAISLETRGSFIFSFPKAIKIKPEQSMPFFVVPPN